jgi:cytochrome oxidase Cu insertion factor (SCO1/SenC/PrrC family)
MTHSDEEQSRAGVQARRGQRGAFSPRQILVLLGVVFVAPILVAWLMYFGAERGWMSGGTTNRGTLIEPPRTLSLPGGMIGAAGQPFPQDFLMGKWTLVYVGDLPCEAVCRETLHSLRQVRLAQGEEMRRVQRLFLTADRMQGELAGILADYPDLAVALFSEGQAGALASQLDLDGPAMQGAGRVYLVDPLGNLMMYYPRGADPRGMVKDLERLLKYSQVG